MNLFNPKPIALFLFISLLAGCATFKSANVDRIANKIEVKDQDVNIFLIGDSGLPEEGNTPSAMKSMQDKFHLADENDVLLFLGDNVYQRGIPNENDPGYATAKLAIDVQLDVAMKFPGQSYFIPGNHDWYSGLDGLERQEKMVEKALGKNSFLPKNGCPIDLIDVSDELSIITIDSHWYLTNWDKVPAFNEQCDEIKTREKFWVELSGLINKQQNKKLIIALHHPLFSNGNHNGDFKANLAYPGQFVRKLTGVSNTDLHHPRYRELSARMTALIESQYNDIIVVAGHEHNLQYIQEKNIRQIVSGSGSKETPLKVRKGHWGFAGKGFAILQIHNQDEQTVTFFDQQGEQLEGFEMYQFTGEYENEAYNNQLEGTQSAAIYPKELVDRLSKGGINGERYREYYGKDYNLPIADLSSLYGGLEPVKLGGGFQTVSLRLKDKDGKEYAMRRVRKSATQFIQKELFKTLDVQDYLDGTFPEKFIFDFFTTAYPFGAVTIADMADAANVYHSNPKLYYVPKQDVLGKFNEFIGDDIYMIEERPAKEWKDLESFGQPDDIDSSDKLFKSVLGDENKIVDKDQYIRSRLFDMWLNDWDRHEDQWRWAVFEKDGDKEIAQAIPRDRDQAFARYDGFIMTIARGLSPELRKLRTIEDDIKSVKFMNYGNYKLDLVILQNTELDRWLKEAEFLQQALTDDVIEQAFRNLPVESQDETSKEIQEKLKARRSKIKKWAEEYHGQLARRVVITATNKDDFIDIHRNENKEVEVKIYRNKNGERKDKYVDQVLNPDVTKQVWIYGLNDKDEYTITGGSSPIKLYLVGGEDNDTYTSNKKNNIRILDFKSTENTLNDKAPTKDILDDYDANHFNINNFLVNDWSIIPSIGFNPDDGIQPGLLAIHRVNRFNNEGFAAIHNIGATYFTNTQGGSLTYSGEFVDAIGKWSFGVEGNYSTPSFAENFFGYGNNTNFDQDIDFDFYRVRQEQYNIIPSFYRDYNNLGKLSISFPFDRINLDDNEGRLIEGYFQDPNNNQLDANSFVGAEIAYEFSNSNSNSFPSLGINLDLSTGYKYNIDNDELSFYYFKPELSFEYPILYNRLVLASEAVGSFQFADEIVPFVFGTTFGGTNGLRGFRIQRFTGESGFKQSTDLRLKLGRGSSFLVPGSYGIFGSFDYGKVWLNDRTIVPSFIADTDFIDEFQTDVGGGLFFNFASLFTFQTSFFSGDEGGRFAGGLTFDF